MRTIYLDNYRGFHDTFVPLVDMNFLVGENSTGKSSILSIIKLMSSTSFWNSDDFNTEEIELGVFNELMTETTGRTRQFTLGYKNSENENSFFFKNALATYRNRNGSPKMYQFRTLIDGTSFLFMLDRKLIKYKTKPYSSTVKADDNSDFKSWILDNDFTGEKYKVFRNEDIPDQPIMYDIRKIIRIELSNSRSSESGSRPSVFPYLIWISPIRIKPKRIYESFKYIFSSEGNHTPLLIKHILANLFKKHVTKTEFRSIIEKFGNESHLFDKIEINNLGRDSASPFILNVYLNGKPLKITNVGYGVGQVLPLLAEIIVAAPNRWFAIQQPEVHLHPRAQAALGDFLHYATKERHLKFIIETHSDFIIDRFRIAMKKNRKSITSQVLFFERNNGKNTLTPIQISKDGNYSEDQPKGFRDFFIKEELNLLAI